MAAWIIALIFALGASAWVYNKVDNRTGSADKKISTGAAAVCFVIVFFVLWSLITLIPND